MCLWGCMQPRKLQCYIWRDSIKPSLRFSWFCVFFVSKGNPFWLIGQEIKLISPCYTFHNIKVCWVLTVLCGNNSNLCPMEIFLADYWCWVLAKPNLLTMKTWLTFKSAWEKTSLCTRAFALIPPLFEIQSTPVISNSKGLTETLRDIRTSTYQSLESEENNKLNNDI